MRNDDQTRDSRLDSVIQSPECPLQRVGNSAKYAYKTQGISSNFYKGILFWFESYHYGNPGMKAPEFETACFLPLT